MDTFVVQKPEYVNMSGNNMNAGTNNHGNATPQPTLRECVHTAVSNYFQHLEGEMPTNLYELVLAEVEAPLLEVVMDKVRDNQTRASIVLGLNRGTLRKKLKQYDMCK